MSGNENANTGWTGGQNAFGDFAPGLVHYTDKVLFDEVWERTDLSKRDRSLVTVAALTALGKLDQLQFHLAFARRNGVTDAELKEALLQLAFYAGWPNGMGATTVLKNIIEGESTQQTCASPVSPAINPRNAAVSEFDQIFPLGAENDAFAQYFTGQSYNAPLAGGSVPVSNISFEPACRNNWHIHHGTDGGGDQILMCTAGSGWYQAEGEQPVSMQPGSVIRVPAGTKHWHGAKADSWFSHLALITPGAEVSNEWLEPVTDEVYGALPTHADQTARS